MTDGALKQYILSDDQAWNNLTTKERRELVSLRQSKMLLPAYRERITAEDADIICGTLTQRLTDDTEVRENNRCTRIFSLWAGAFGDPCREGEDRAMGIRLLSGAKFDPHIGCISGTTGRKRNQADF